MTSKPGCEQKGGLGSAARAIAKREPSLVKCTNSTPNDSSGLQTVRMFGELALGPSVPQPCWGGFIWRGALGTALRTRGDSVTLQVA